MAKDALRIFFSSPADCQDLFKKANEAVAQYNELSNQHPSKPIFSIFNYKMLQSDFGNNPQNLINNKLFPKDKSTIFEFYVGVLKHRFGQPTNNYDSGTEEEFYQAIEHFKNGNDVKAVAFLFSKEPLLDSGDNSLLEQKIKVNDFKNKISLEGLYKTFSNLDDFKAEFLKLLNAWSESSTEASISKLQNRDSFGNLRISEEFLHQINKIDELLWSKSDAKTLEETWIEPKITFYPTSQNKNESILQTEISFNELINSLTAGESTSLTGWKDTGKTALGRLLFLKLIKNQAEYIPVLVKGEEIRHSDKKDIFKRLKSLLCQQYENISQEDAKKFSEDKLIVILDDLSRSQISSFDRLKLREEIHQKAHSCILLGRETDDFEVQDSKKFEDEIAKTIKVARIHPPKSERTEAMIRKWSSLNNDIDQEDNDVIKISKELDHVFRSGYLERNFFNILLLLKTIKIDSINKNEKGDVFYYKLLVLNYLQNNLEKTQIRDAEELLSRLAWQGLKSSNLQIPEAEVQEILNAWAEKNGLSITSLQAVLCDLVRYNILEKENEALIFCQHYVASYYEAKVLYEKLSQENENAKEILKKFSHETWTRKSAMTLEFFASLEHGNVILDLVIKKIKKSFKKYEGSILKIDDPKILILGGNKFIPSGKIDLQNSSQESRKKHLRERDKYSEERNEQYKIHERLGDVEELFASIRVAGNLLRENYSSLSKAKKKEILLESTLAMRRLLGGVFAESSENYRQFVQNKNEKEVQIISALFQIDTLIRLLISLYWLSERLGDNGIDYSLYYNDDQDILHKFYLLACNLESHSEVDFKTLETFIPHIKNKPLIYRTMQIFIRYRIEYWRPKMNVAQKLCNLAEISYKAPSRIALTSEK